MIKNAIITFGTIIVLSVIVFIAIHLYSNADYTNEKILGNAPFKLNVNISKTDLQIGDPFKVYVKLYSRNNIPVYFSGLNKSAIKNAILLKSIPSTNKGNKITLTSYTYYLQSDSLKQIQIPSIVAQYNNLKQLSKPVLITPKSVLNKDVKQINDIKSIDSYLVIKPWYLLIPIMLIAVMVLAILLVKKLIKKLKSITKPEKAPLPQDIALEELNKLRNYNLSSIEEFDVFHTKLSEIIRKYLEGRFNIKAIEKTTEELFPEILNLDLDNRFKTHLKHVLKESDLVKFAQYSISKNNSYLYLENTIDFVHKTMLVPENINDKKDE